MKKYARDNSVRKAKTDRLDLIMITSYAIDNWFKLKSMRESERIYSELETSRQEILILHGASI